MTEDELRFKYTKRDPFAFQYNGGLSMFDSSSLPKYDKSFFKGVNVPKSPSAGGGSPMGAMGVVAGAIGSMMPGEKRNDEFAASGAFKNKDKYGSAFDTGEKVLGSIPTPVTQAIAGFSKLGRAIGRQTTNEYGLYKGKGAEVVDNVFNPQRGVQHSIMTAKDVFNGGGFDGQSALNLASAGLLSKSGVQKEAEKRKNLFDLGKRNDQMYKGAILGNQISTLIPNYQPPAYGKNGMKFRTKFGNK